MPTAWSARVTVSDADRAAVRACIRTGSKSFSAASRLLPPRLREAAFALYGFCRLSDDLVDVAGGAEPAILDLQQRLAAAYQGRPCDSAIDRAFAEIVQRYAIPRALPEALIDGLAWDVAGVPIETLADLFAYATRVAGSVGAMMTVLMGVQDEAVIARACDLGIAMQLTNIARDVGEDARNGRLYLPRAWLREEGLDPDRWLAAPCQSPVIVKLVDRLLAIAEQLYRRADSGILGLPLACRPGIFAARHIYREIGLMVMRGGAMLNRRARVSAGRKWLLLGRALVQAALPVGQIGREPAVAEATYLVEATRDRPRPRAPVGVADRIVWVAELFAALDNRQRVGNR